MKCAVLTCLYNNINVKQIQDDISFHRFPTTLRLQKQWLDNIGRPDWIPARNDSVCSLHFKKLDYSTETSRRILLPGAVPWLQILEVNEAVPWDGDANGNVSMSFPKPNKKVSTTIKTADKTSNVPTHWDDELDIPIYPIPTVNSIIPISNGSNDTALPNANNKPATSSASTEASNGLFAVKTPTLQTGSYSQPTIQFSVQPISTILTIPSISTISPISIPPISTIEPIPTIKIEDDDDPLAATESIQQHIKENIELVDVNEIILDKNCKVIGYRKVTKATITPGTTNPIKRTQLPAQPHRTVPSQTKIHKNNLNIIKPAPPPLPPRPSLPNRPPPTPRPSLPTRPPPPPPLPTPQPDKLTLKQALDDKLACYKCKKLRTQVVKQKKSIKLMSQQLRRKSKQILRLKMMLILMKERIQKGNGVEHNDSEED